MYLEGNDTCRKTGILFVCVVQYVVVVDYLMSGRPECLRPAGVLRYPDRLSDDLVQGFVFYFRYLHLL